MTTEAGLITALQQKQRRLARFGLLGTDPVLFLQRDRAKQRERVKRFGDVARCEYYFSPKESEGMIRSDTLYVHGVDFLSTDQVTEYFQAFGPVEVEWLNDSSCNVRFASGELALLALRTNLVSPNSHPILDSQSNPLSAAFGYCHGGISIPLILRFATDKVRYRQDVKSRDVTGRDSKYYRWKDGVLRKGISRREGRMRSGTSRLSIW